MKPFSMTFRMLIIDPKGPDQAIDVNVQPVNRRVEGVWAKNMASPIAFDKTNISLTGN